MGGWRGDKVGATEAAAEVGRNYGGRGEKWSETSGAEEGWWHVEVT